MAAQPRETLLRVPPRALIRKNHRAEGLRPFGDEPSKRGRRAKFGQPTAQGALTQGRDQKARPHSPAVVDVTARAPGPAQHHVTQRSIIWPERRRGRTGRRTAKCRPRRDRARIEPQRARGGPCRGWTDDVWYPRGCRWTGSPEG